MTCDINKIKTKRKTIVLKSKPECFRLLIKATPLASKVMLNNNCLTKTLE